MQHIKKIDEFIANENTIYGSAIHYCCWLWVLYFERGEPFGDETQHFWL